MFTHIIDVYTWSVKGVDTRSFLSCNAGAKRNFNRTSISCALDQVSNDTKLRSEYIENGQ